MRRNNTNISFTHTGYTEPRPGINKGKPNIQRITFSKEEQEGINNILEGKRNKYTKHLTPTSTEYKKKLLKQKFYKGICGLCDQLPEYRVLYDMGGAILKENYCLKHFRQYFPEELV